MNSRVLGWGFFCFGGGGCMLQAFCWFQFWLISHSVGCGMVGVFFWGGGFLASFVVVVAAIFIWLTLWTSRCFLFTPPLSLVYLDDFLGLYFSSATMFFPWTVLDFLSTVAAACLVHLHQLASALLLSLCLLFDWGVLSVWPVVGFHTLYFCLCWVCRSGLRTVWDRRVLNVDCLCDGLCPSWSDPVRLGGC